MILIYVCVSVHMVLIKDLHLVFWPVGDLETISQQSLNQSLEQLFQGVLQKLQAQEVQEATEQTARLLFKLYDRWKKHLPIQLASIYIYIYMHSVYSGLDDTFCREKTGFVLLRSVEVALIVLSGDTLAAKHKGLTHKMICILTQVTNNWLIYYINKHSYI